MKVGFGGGKGKKKGKKKDKKATGTKKGDAAMADAREPQHEDQRRHEGEGSQPATAKDRLRERMALKQDLKVKVAGLKKARAKLTKLAGNKDARRSLNNEMRSLVKMGTRNGKEGRGRGSGGGGGGSGGSGSGGGGGTGEGADGERPAQAIGGGDAMDE